MEKCARRMWSVRPWYYDNTARYQIDVAKV